MSNIDNQKQLCFPSIVIYGCNDSNLLIAGNYSIITLSSLTFLVTLFGLYLFKKRRGKGSIINGFLIFMFTSIVFIVQATLAIYPSVSPPILAFLVQSLPSTLLMFMFHFINQISRLIPPTILAESRTKVVKFFNLLKSLYFLYSAYFIISLGVLLTLIGYANPSDRRFVLLFGLFIPAIYQCLGSIIATAILVLSKRSLQKLLREFNSANEQMDSLDPNTKTSGLKKLEIKTTLERLITTSRNGSVAILCTLIGYLYSVVFYESAISIPSFRILPWIMVSVLIPSLLLAMTIGVMVSEMKHSQKSNEIMINESATSYKSEGMA